MFCTRRVSRLLCALPCALFCTLSVALSLCGCLTLAFPFLAHAAVEVNEGTVTYSTPGNTCHAPDGYVNKDDLTATSSGGGSNGIYVGSDGFTNHGLLTLAGSGRSAVLYNTSGNDLRLLSTSVLALGGGHIYMDGSSPNLQTQPGSQVLSLVAANGGSIPAMPIFRGLTGTVNGTAVSIANLTSALNLTNGPVLGYSVVDNGSGSYDIATTRKANASDFVGDNAGDFVAQLENTLNGQPLDTLFGPLHNFALLRTYIDSQSTVGGVRAAADKAARVSSPPRPRPTARSP